ACLRGLVAIDVHGGEIEPMCDSIRLEGDRALEIDLRILPLRFTEHATTEQIPRRPPLETAEAHDLRVPHSENVQRARVQRIETECRVHLVVHDTSVLDLVALALRERDPTE